MYALSDSGDIFLNNEEGFRNCPYLDVKGVPTIGFGTTHYPNGNKVMIGDHCITESEAVTYRDTFINKWICPVLQKEVTVKLTQPQVDSLISFVYNVGPGAFETSHLLQKINDGAPCSEIHAEFAKWVKSGGKVIQGLVDRRKREANLFCQ